MQISLQTWYSLRRHTLQIFAQMQLTMKGVEVGAVPNQEVSGPASCSTFQSRGSCRKGLKPREGTTRRER